MTQQTQNKAQEAKQRTGIKNQPNQSNQPNQPEFKDTPLDNPQSNMQNKDKSYVSGDASKSKSKQGQNTSSNVKEEGCCG